jgi:acyl-CoA synthetase (AMP-forming)/AMP-acid ligase II
MNIFDAFLIQGRHQPTALAICTPGTGLDRVSYGRLAEFVHNVGQHALAAGLKPKDTVAIFARDMILHWALVLGLGRIGIVTLSGLDPALPGGFRIDAVLSDVLARYPHAQRVIPVDAGWLEGDGKPPAVESEPDRNATARIILTSGTTGDPKAVALSHDIIIRRIQAFDVAFGNRIPSTKRTFVDLGIQANIGYLWGIYTFARGGALFLRGADPADTLQAFSLYQVQCMVAAPGGMAEFLGYYERSPAFECPFEVMLSVGSMLSKALSERVRARMCTHVVSAYGATEGNPVAGAPHHQIADIQGAVGYVAPGMIVEAADVSGNTLPRGTEGLIRFRGHSCVSGYLGNPPGSEAIFRDGWIYPGDIGSVTEDGVLVITGREKVIIDLGGDKINPETIERVLTSYPGVVHAAAFGRPNAFGIEEVWAAVVMSPDIQPEALQVYCGNKLPIEHVPTRILTLPDIPRSPAGKIDRKRLLELAKSLSATGEP